MTLEIIKASERKKGGLDMIILLAKTGWEVKELGEYRKFNKKNGLEIPMAVKVYKLTNKETKDEVYTMLDILDRFMIGLTPNCEAEIYEYISKKQYKTDKQFHIEDCGMTEELYELWNEQ